MNKLKRLKKLYSMIPYFECIDNCGECCGVPGIYKYEMKRINRFIKKNNLKINFEMEWKLNKLLFISLNEKRNCSALSENKKCLIYPVRPAMCRLYGVIEDLKCPHKKAIKYLTREKAENILNEFKKLI